MDNFLLKNIIFATIINTIDFAILMIPASIKYGSVLLLLTIFLLKGLSSVLPLIAGYSELQDRHKIDMNAGAENTKEKSSEKTIEIKEFLGHFYNDNLSYPEYILLANTATPGNSPFKKEVFLSIDTPPPRMIK